MNIPLVYKIHHSIGLKVLLAPLLFFALLFYSIHSFALWGIYEYSTEFPAVGSSGGYSLSPKFNCSDYNYHKIPATCTVTLIGTKTVISATHCHYHLGERLMCNKKGEKVVTNAVDSFNLSDYLGEPTNANNDILIMELDAPEESITPIPFNTNASQLQLEEQVWGVGLGNGAEIPTPNCWPPECPAVSGRKRVGINKLNEITPTIVKIANPGQPLFDTLRFFSGGSGDSGGPLLMTDHTGNKVTVGTTRGSGAYTRIDTRAEWIMSVSNYNARPGPPVLESYHSVRLRARNYNKCQYIDEKGINVKAKMDYCPDVDDPKFAFNLQVNNAGLFRIVNQHDQKCLYLDLSSGRRIKTENCTASSYRWSIYERSEGRFLFIERPSDGCLYGWDPGDLSQSVGCSESSWLEYNIDTPTVSEFYITNNKTGFKLRPAGSSDGSPIIATAPSDTSDWVKFRKVPLEGGYFHLQNVQTGKYFRPVSSADGSVLEQRPTSFSGKRTQWTLTETNSGDYHIVNRWTGKHIRPATRTVDGPVIIRPNTFTGTMARWRLDPSL